MTSLSRSSFEAPIFLQVSESKSPLYTMGEFEKDPATDHSSSGLKDGLLKPHALKMIHYIVRFFRSQPQPTRNIAVLMICREFLEWINFVSGAPYNLETLDKLRRRKKYLDQLSELCNGLEGDQFTLLIAFLEKEVLLIISMLELGLSESQQIESLDSIIDAAKGVLSYGFNYLYYFLSDVKDLPYPNISFFCSKDPIYGEVTKTQAGQLLENLRNSPECRFIFP